MTHEAKPHDPIIKQHLDKIEDQIVVDAIAKRMANTHDKDGPRYSHETYIGTRKSMQYIARACHDVFEPGLDHEEVWQRALQSCIDNVQDLTEKIDNPQPHADLLDNLGMSVSDLMKNRAHFTEAALSMYALDRHSRTIDSTTSHPIDALITSRNHGIDQVVRECLDDMQADGVVVFDSDTSKATAIAESIAIRRIELEQNNYSYVMNSVSERLSSMVSIKEVQEELRELRLPLMEMRLAGSITKEQRDAFAAAVYQATAKGHWESAQALEGLPESYLRNAYVDKSISTSYLNATIKEYTDRLIGDTSRGDVLTRCEIYTVLHRYLPGGLTGEAAKHDITIQRLKEYFNETYLDLLLDAMPLTAYQAGEGRRKEIQEHNDTIRSVMQSACREILDDSEFAEKLYEDMRRSLEPRVFMDDEASYPNGDIRPILKRLQYLTSIYGSDGIRDLHQSYDLSALDEITDKDIATYVGLKNGDPAVIERLQKQDVTLMTFDPHGCRNGGIASIVEQLNITNDERLGRVLVPWRRVGDFYRAIALLEQRKVQFCTLVDASHGRPGSTSHNKGDEAFKVTSFAADSYALFTGDSRPNVKVLSIGSSQLGRIVRDRMCMPKFAKELGMPDKKRVINANCSSDVAPSGGVSIAESVARTVSRAELTIPPLKQGRTSRWSREQGRRASDGTIDAVSFGTENVTNVRPNQVGQGLFMYGHERGVEDDDEQPIPYKSNMMILEPRARDLWLGNTHFPNHTTIDRSQFSGRIIA